MYNVARVHPLNEKALRERQTLRAGCSKVEPNNFARRRVGGGRKTAKI